MENGSGEMTQKLKILATVLEDSSSIPNTHMVTHNISNSGLTRCDIFFWPPQAPDTHMAQRHTWRQNTHMQKKLFKFFNRE